MNIYDALNQGDGSLKEPHFTSLLFYLFKVSKDEFPKSSFLDQFIQRFAPGYPNSIDCNFDLETDLKIEEILIHRNLRRDTDIIVFLRQNGLLMKGIEFILTLQIQILKNYFIIRIHLMVITLEDGRILESNL